MKIWYARRKQPRLAGMGDGKWHRVLATPVAKMPVSEMSVFEFEEYMRGIECWRIWGERPKTFCGQAYIAKYWLTAPDHDHFREVCEDCEAEIAAQVLIGKLVVD